MTVNVKTIKTILGLIVVGYLVWVNVSYYQMRKQIETIQTRSQHNRILFDRCLTQAEKTSELVTIYQMNTKKYIMNHEKLLMKEQFRMARK
jgi:hypothetical protein